MVDVRGDVLRPPHKISLSAVKLFQDHGINVDRVERLSLSEIESKSLVNNFLMFIDRNVN